MVTNNSANITGAGIVKHNATGGFTPVTPVQYNLLIGGADNSMTSVAPSATAGVPFVSQGASSNATCGTMSVEGGGTGATSLTGVLTGHGTSTVTANPVTNGDILTAGASNTISSLSTGTDGQLLVAATGAPSAFATLSTNGGITSAVSANALTLNYGPPIGPASTFFEDDFMGRKIGGWAPFAGSVGTISFNTSANATHPGLFVVNCQMSALSKYGLWQGNFAVGGGEISCTWIISASYASSSSERYKLKVGLSEEYFTGAPFLGFSYAYNENSGKLICGGGNTTTGFTGVFPTFQVFRVVVSADGTSATYYAGAKISTLSSIATAATGLGAGTILGPAFFVGWNTDPAPAVNFFLDYVSVTNTFTTPR